MFLYVLLFLNSCLSTPSRQISSTGIYQAWYAGFDKQLKPEDSSWSPKLYYSPALDNFRKFGTYTHKEENELRSYLKDRFNPNGNSLYPALEKLLLVLFPSPNGSLSITSASNSNLNTFISRLPTGDIQKNLLTKEIALAQVLNIVYKILSLPTNEKSKNNINTLRKELYSPIIKIFSEYYTENEKTFDKTNLQLPNLIKSFFNPLLNFIEQDRGNSEEKELIQHAFMKWALMHVGITNSNSVVTLIDNLPFFRKVSEDNNENNLAQLSESEKLFQEAGIGFSDPDNIYLANAPFENGSTYAFNQEGEQTQELFPDCAESTLRHFFNYALKKEGKFQILQDFHPKLKEYYKKATDTKVLGTDIVSRTAWNKVVSHIPGAEYRENNNELFPNISNILHVIEYLLTNKPKDFQELTTDAMVQEKFKNIKVILDKIKPISLAESSLMNKQYKFNNFFIMNIHYNKHAFATVQKNDKNNKQLVAIDSKNLNLLEYSLLANFFSFDTSKFNNYKNIIPFFQSSISDITTILNFFEQSNELDKDYLDTCSSYIGRVLSSALWEDNAIKYSIYQSEKLTDLIKIAKNPENILQGIKFLPLIPETESSFESFKGPLLATLKENLLLLTQLTEIDFWGPFPDNSEKDIAQVILNNKESIKKARILSCDNKDGLLKSIFSCIHLKELEISKSPLIEGHLSFLSDLIELKYLDLSNNNLKESIPKELEKLVKLQRLELATNQLIGSIPKELGNLTKLEYLLLSNNKLTGSIPTELGKLIQLRELHLEKNQLNESIPKELGKLVQLRELHLEKNQLNESIPEEIGNLTKLWSLDLSSNQLTGSIPKELGSLTQLKTLFLNDNELTGSIPVEIGKLTNLSGFKVQDNKLTGSIPKELGELKSLTILNLSGNQLTGSIPKELEKLVQLWKLDLSSNQLTGSIPKELGNLTQLRFLWLMGNQLTGSIPKSLKKLRFYEETINPQITIIRENGIKREEERNLPVAEK